MKAPVSLLMNLQKKVPLIPPLAVMMKVKRLKERKKGLIVK